MTSLLCFRSRKNLILNVKTFLCHICRPHHNNENEVFLTCFECNRLFPTYAYKTKGENTVKKRPIISIKVKASNILYCNHFKIIISTAIHPQYTCVKILIVLWISLMTTGFLFRVTTDGILMFLSNDKHDMALLE